MALTPVPKPEGYELRTKRADTTADASKWLPEDALYEAYLEMQKDPVSHALIIAWFTQNEAGEIRRRMRLYNATCNDGKALGVEMFHVLTTDPI